MPRYCRSSVVLLGIGAWALGGAAPPRPAVPPQRVTVTGRAAVVQIARPPQARPVAALGTYKSVEWFDSPDGRDTLPTSPGQGLVVLAGDLSLGGKTYKVDAPLVVLVADTLRITGDVAFDLSARRPDGAGGRMLVLANRLVCAGGTLKVTSRGEKLGGAGGDLIVGAPLEGAAPADAPTPPPCVALEAPGGPGGERTPGGARALGTGRARTPTTGGGEVVRDHRYVINVTKARIGCLRVQTEGNLTSVVGQACNGKPSCSYKAPTEKQYKQMGVHARREAFCTQGMEITYQCGQGDLRTVEVKGDAWNHPPAQLVCTAPKPPPPAPAQPATEKVEPGSVGAVRAFRDARAAADGVPGAGAVLSAWPVLRVEALYRAVADASRRRDVDELLALFEGYQRLEDAQVEGELAERYLDTLNAMNEARGKVLQPLYVDELIVQPVTIPQTLSVFVEGATLRTTVGPTHALAARTTVAGKSVFGVLEYRDDRPDEIAIEAEWELTIDPWVEQVARKRLAEKGRRLEGAFTGWSLEAKPIDEIGVRSASAVLLPGGRRIRVRLAVDGARANMVLWRLLSSNGLAWTVDWTFTEAGTGRVVKGNWAGPPLSLTKRREQPVRVVEGRLVNSGTVPLTVSYLRAGDGEFHPLHPALRLGPGESVPLPERAPREGVSVPPEAVEAALDPNRFAEELHIVNAAQNVDRVVVRNALPSVDPERGNLDYVEVYVSSRPPGASAAEAAVAGPFQLSAAGTRGAEIAVPFLRLGRGERQVTVSGRAFYVGGSFRTLSEATFDTTTIVITAEQLRP